MNLPGHLQLISQAVLGMFADFFDRGTRCQRFCAEQREGRLADRITGPHAVQCHQPPRLYRFTFDRGTNAARMRQVEESGGCEDMAATWSIQARLRGCIINQQQEQVLGDLRHGLDTNARLPGVPNSAPAAIRSGRAPR